MSGVTATAEELPFYGYNGEEYNPVTGLVYLRYRYYSPEMGAFIAEDDYLGTDENVNSQNRYSYCEGDPINYHDPTGHAKSLREIQMQYGLDTTAQQFQNYANGQSYGLNLISDSTANSYIQRGRDKAYGVNSAYNCESGENTQKAIGAMAADINAAKDSANDRIQENIDREAERRKKGDGGGSNENDGNEGGFTNIPPTTYQGKLLRKGSEQPDWKAIYDEGFPYDPNEKPTQNDYKDWAIWGGLNIPAHALVPDGAKAYSHYRSKKGTDLDFDIEKLYKQVPTVKNFFDGLIDDSIYDAEYIAIAERFKARPFGTNAFDTDLDTVINVTSELKTAPYYDNFNWDLAVGGFSCWVFGKIIFGKSKMSLDLYLTVKDRYNFDKNKKEKRFGVLDSVNGRFSTLGWAREFTSVGTLHRKVVWVHGKAYKQDFFNTFNGGI